MTDMKFIIALVLVGIIFIIFLIMILNAESEFNDRWKQYPKIKFKSFKKFYVVNPKRWKLENNYVICVYDNRSSNEYKKYGYYTDYEIKLRFGFLETYLYQRWLKTQKKKAKKQEDIKTISKVLSIVKCDITELEKNANEQINKSIELQNQVLKNLREDKDFM